MRGLWKPRKLTLLDDIVIFASLVVMVVVAIIVGCWAVTYLSRAAVWLQAWVRGGW